MTRRIAISIILTAWTILIVGGAAAYLLTRQILLAELDEQLVLRAQAVPLIVGVSEEAGQYIVPSGDRYMIRNDLGRVVARSSESSGPIQVPPKVTGKSWSSLSDGRVYRTVTLRVIIHSVDGTQTPATVVYSGPADHFQKILSRLAILLVALGVFCGLSTAAAAVLSARSALRPLEETAQTIGAIDERQLDRRIEVQRLPQELRPMGERLNQMLQRLEESFTLRKHFLADAAHELRTPVAALLTTLEVALRRPREAATLTATLQACLTDVKMLRQLVETLLEHVRGENITRRVSEPTDVSAILGECSATGEALGRPKNVRVYREFPPNLRIVTQPDRLRSVVMNLISNAVEYNQQGGTVHVSAFRENGALHISVADTGVGISEEALPRVFEPFFRGDRSNRPESSHLGLGLFLVRSHIEALEGKVSIESQAGRGTTFTVILPAGSGAAPELHPEATDVSPANAA